MMDRNRLDLSGEAARWQDMPRSAVLANAEMIVADLDQTLAFTKHVHFALLRSFIKKVDDTVQDHSIEKRYSELRGKSYADILEGLKELCKESAGAAISNENFTDTFLRFVQSDQAATATEKATEVPGARALLEEIRALRVPLVVCTGSPRPLAERFLSDTGLNHLVDGTQLYCWGDTKFSKGDPGFWDPILDGIARDRVVALDDHPHSAEYVLGVGRIGKLIANPSIPPEGFESITTKFPDRIKLIKATWGDWT
jgi:beta-phosphoglucomutase-like phosphatase (HAD superfamily)